LDDDDNLELIAQTEVAICVMTHEAVHVGLGASFEEGGDGQCGDGAVGDEFHKVHVSSCPGGGMSHGNPPIPLAMNLTPSMVKEMILNTLKGLVEIAHNPMELS